MKRREFLRNASVGGSALLLPVMRQVYAQANGASPPKRFIFFLESNGRTANFYQPSGEIPWRAGEYNTNDRLVDLPLTAEIGSGGERGKSLGQLRSARLLLRSLPVLTRIPANHWRKRLPRH